MARMQRIDPDVLTCLDYLIAGIDYPSFQQLMLNFKFANAWEDEQ